MGSGLAEDFGSLVILVFAAAFPIVNPAGSALIFLDLTRHAPHRAREQLARMIALYSFIVLVVSLFVGSYVLEFFGISIPALRVAGGIVVAAAGWKFLQEHETEESDDAVKAEAPEQRSLIGMAFYPFTMPITTGPGTISVMIALGTGHTSHDPFGQRIMFGAAALVANAAIAILVYLCFAFADRVRSLLGNTGTTILLRLSAFILFCIGVQILWSGLAEFLAPWKLH